MTTVGIAHTHKSNTYHLNFPIIVQDIKNILQMFTINSKQCSFLCFGYIHFFLIQYNLLLNLGEYKKVNLEKYLKIQNSLVNSYLETIA